MAEQVTLAARPRAGTGKGEARALRREGRVPAIAYGGGLVPQALSVDALELYHALRTEAGENAVLRLDVEGDTHLAMAREVQRHPVKRITLHVDFVAIDRNQPVNVEVPLVLEGQPAGADEGGVLEQQLHALPIEVLPLEVPDQLVLDVAAMQIGDVLRVADVPVPDGVTVHEDLERTIATLNVPQMDVPETETAAEAEAAEGMAEGATGAEAADTAGFPVEAVEE
jgi:large subunit ribosomal protein L25